MKLSFNIRATAAMCSNEDSKGGYTFYINLNPIQIRAQTATEMAGRVVLLGGVGRTEGSETRVGVAPTGTEIGPTSG